MKNKKITCTLSTKSFRDAAEKIRRSKDELERKCNTFVKLVAAEGFKVVSAVLQEHVDTGETIGSVRIEEKNEFGRFTAAVRVTSDAIMFLEFGSGLVGMGTAPHADEFGMGSGTYPSQVPIQDRNGNYENWNNPEGWVYYKDGRKHRSFGMAASMPMYQGGKAMRESIEKIAKEVF